VEHQPANEHTDMVMSENEYEDEIRRYHQTELVRDKIQRKMLSDLFSVPPPPLPRNVDRGESDDSIEFERWYNETFSDATLSDCPKPTAPPAQPVPDTSKDKKPLMTRVRDFMRRADTVSKEPVTLNMWHNHWQSRPYGKGPMCNQVDLIPSVAHPNVRWKVINIGGPVWTLEDVPVQHPESGGASDDSSYAYGPEETRPPKRLEVACFMDVRGLPYVDLELYIALKEYTLENGTIGTTYPKLHRLAKSKLATYRVNHLPPELLLEIKHWTVLAAMIPTTSEMAGIKMMANAKLYKQMGESARFKRDGSVAARKRWWQFGPQKFLQMYKPAPT
jgi:hypothetical protein